MRRIINETSLSILNLTLACNAQTCRHPHNITSFYNLFIETHHSSLTRHAIEVGDHRDAVTP